MTKKSIKFEYCKGNPTKLGVSLEDGGVNFAIAIPNINECILNIYKKEESDIYQSIRLDDNYKMGSVFSVFIKNFDYTKYEYLYEVKNKIFIDPYAKMVKGRENWGNVISKKNISNVRGGFYFEKFDWKDDKKPNISYDESIFYKLHVRGFTMDNTSNVVKKGTFEGIREKISYFKELGVTTLVFLPIYEFDEILVNEFIIGPEEPKYMHYRELQKMQEECSKKNSRENLNKLRELEGVIPYKINYWGFSNKCNYFSPKVSYAYDKKNAIKELKTLIYDLHKENIEVVMNINFVDNTNKELISDCLEYWVMEYHVDGFVLNNNVVPIDFVASRPLFSEIKIITNYFEINNIYSYEFIPKNKNLAELNDSFMVDARRFLRGDEQQVKNFTNRYRRNPKKHAVINYVSNYYGFTLNDLYSYDIKHNEDNGEYNRDGNEYNFSWNCGVEGNSKNKKILQMRKKMIKNAFTLLLLSQSTPMILSGDEMCNSQNGNNNAYCQDEEIGWLNWNNNEFSKEIFEFTKKLIQFRKKHNIFHMKDELRIMDYMAKGYPDLSYHGLKSWYPDYSLYSRILGIMLCGEYAEDDYFYIAINMHWEPHKFELPILPHKLSWRVVVDTHLEGTMEDTIIKSIPKTTTYKVAERTIVVFGSMQKG